METCLELLPNLRRAVDLRLAALHAEAYPAGLLYQDSAYLAEFERVSREYSRDKVEHVRRATEGGAASIHRLALLYAMTSLDSITLTDAQRRRLWEECTTPHLPSAHRYAPLSALQLSEQFWATPGQRLTVSPIVDEIAGSAPSPRMELLMGFVSNAHRGLHEGPIPSHAVATYLLLVRIGPARTMDVLRHLYRFGWLPWRSTFVPLFTLLARCRIAIEPTRLTTISFGQCLQFLRGSLDGGLLRTRDDVAAAAVELCDEAYERISSRIRAIEKQARSLGNWWRDLLELEAEILIWLHLADGWRQDPGFPDSARTDLDDYHRAFEEHRGPWAEAVPPMILGSLKQALAAEKVLPEGRGTERHHFRFRPPQPLVDEAVKALSSVPPSERPEAAARLYIEWVSTAPRELQHSLGETPQVLASSAPLFAMFFGERGGL